MGNDTLLVYQNNNFNDYYKQRESEGIRIFTFSYLELKQNNLNFLLDCDEVDVDITSAVQLITYGNGAIRYFIEKIYYILDEFDIQINYIISENQAKNALKELGIIFKELIYIKGEKYTIESNIDEVKQDRKVKLVNQSTDDLSKLSEYLSSNIIGHANFKDIFIKEINSFRYFHNVIGDQPILSIFLLGESGVGKTEVGRILHRFLDDVSPLAKINLGNYKSESSLSSLIGSPPGYVDSGNESDLVRKIKKSKTGILLVDEFEKSNSAVHNFFLQLLEEGQFDDALGNVHDLKGYVIIFTSNATKKQFSDDVPPELRSRFDLIYYFDPLTEEDKIEVVRRLFEKYERKSRIKLTENEVEAFYMRINIALQNNIRKLKQEVRRYFYEVVSNRIEV